MFTRGGFVCIGALARPDFTHNAQYIGVANDSSVSGTWARELKVVNMVRGETPPIFPPSLGCLVLPSSYLWC